MPSLAVAKAANAAFVTAGYRPTALFVGGTSGVGEGTANAFALATKGNAHIILCGRNKTNADKIISNLLTTSDSKYEFVECDSTLMKNVVKACDEIKSRLGPQGTLNYLVQSQGIMTLNGFNPTTEGIDRKLALHFYSKWKFVDELLPCLETAASSDQEARVMTIFAPHNGAPLDPEDLGLKKKFTLRRAAQQASTYNNLLNEEYGVRHPNVSFIHINPGAVSTPGLTRNAPWYIKMLEPVAKLISKSKEDCGEWMVSALTAPQFKSGSFYLGEHADPVPSNKVHVDEPSRAALLAHYQDEVRTTES